MIFYMLLQLQICSGLWRKGIIHYNINSKDYDLHSQDVIISTFSKIQGEICLRFFMAPSNNISNEKILFISNPDKLKICSPNSYDFNNNVVYFPIAYKCINEKDIARTVVDMVKASIEYSLSPVNSYDHVKRHQLEDEDQLKLLSPIDRNFINFHYYDECHTHKEKAPLLRSADDTSKLTEKNLNYYSARIWPLAIILYGLDESLRGTSEHRMLSNSMASIELSTCLVFQDIGTDDILSPRNFIWFSKNGEEMPHFGFQEGNQTLKLSTMVRGAPGHKAHIINNLMRVIGVHMMSNRYDRDNYISVNWKNVEKGKEHYLERAPEESWLSQIPYDFDSVTHAPANYMCNSCELGDSTVQPIQDHLWQRSMNMGHKTALTESDIQTVNLLYNEQCRSRFERRE